LQAKANIAPESLILTARTLRRCDYSASKASEESADFRDYGSAPVFEGACSGAEVGVSMAAPTQLLGNRKCLRHYGAQHAMSRKLLILALAALASVVRVGSIADSSN
jgi:hypothetical protein